MAKRSFDEAAIVATGSQGFEERFKKRRHSHDVYDAPPIAQWRCNLAGLSQRHNLLFVAYSDKIYVYVPQFSTQALPEHPALIVISQPAVPGLQGYLDPRHPHAINNLVVQQLGTEEVVATVRDDGDVDAFLTRHVVQAIERRAEPGSSIDVEADEVKPFFQSNVGMSAWGLAIHSQARIIATSANTHNITIFKFGLVGAKDDEEPQADEGNPCHDRGMDVTHQVLNGTSNIPYIAFCNTGDDPDARWLLTTDISGFCRSIDLHSMQTSQTFRFGRAKSYPGGNSHDRHNSGWAIMFLDRRSFIPESSFEAALGLEKGEVLPGLNESRTLWDIGSTVSHMTDTCHKFPRTKLLGRSRRSESASTLVSISNASSDDSEDELLLHVNERDEVNMGTSEAGEDSDSGESTYYLGLDSEDEGTEDSVSFDAIYGGKRVYGNEPRAFQPHNNICGDNPCPILHASVRSVYLLQPSAARDEHHPITPPTVGFTNALHQQVQLQYSWLNAFERLNMNAHIPEIGIVILASQKGRALIISLTKLSRRTVYPAVMKGSEDPSNPRTQYAMRIERVVPTAQQEAKLERPCAPLMGIATGPMQGTEHLPEHQKRWRLIMMYADHTVLSYEISRKRTRDSAVDVEGLVV